jgi:hypothetical protein
MFYAEAKKKNTPEPFCELRAFIFTPNKPTIHELKMVNSGLEQVINYSENLFQSIYDAKEAGAILSEDKLHESPVRMLAGATPRAKMVIEGYEIQPIDVDEVAKHFKDDVDKLKFFEIYRYCAFAEADGSIIYDYDEQDIIRIEAIKTQQTQQQVP